MEENEKMFHQVEKKNPKPSRNFSKNFTVLAFIRFRRGIFLLLWNLSKSPKLKPACDNWFTFYREAFDIVQSCIVVSFTNTLSSLQILDDGNP